MKKYLIAFLILLPTLVFAAGSSVTISQDEVRANNGDTAVRYLQFACVSDDTDGSIPNTTVDEDNNADHYEFIKGWYLAEVHYVQGGTAPDAADLYIWDVLHGVDTIDLLGGAGVGIVTAATPTSTPPLLGGFSWIRPITKGFIFDVDNQATNDATYTITLEFIQWY